MKTQKYHLRAALVWMFILLSMACSLPVNRVTTTPAPKNSVPTSATPPRDGNVSSASKTPTVTIDSGGIVNFGGGGTQPVTITITPTITFTPTMPNFDQIINFGGGGGGGYCTGPDLAPNNAMITQTYGGIAICLYLQGIDLDRPFKVSLSQIGGVGNTTSSRDLWLDQVTETLKWTGYQPPNGHADWKGDGKLSIYDIGIWWPPYFPAGQWKLSVEQPNSSFAGFSTSFQVEAIDHASLHAVGTTSKTELVPSDLYSIGTYALRPLTLKDKNKLDIEGHGFPPNVPVYVLLYRCNADESMNLINTFAVNSDSQGSINSILPGSFEKDVPYLLLATSDPNAEIGEGDANYFGQNLPADFFIVAPSDRSTLSEINKKYAALGAQASFLGKPIGSTQNTSDGRDRFREFQYGTIYWTDVGAFEVHGPIKAKWVKLEFGSKHGFLGYPITDELTAPDGIGHFNHFQYGSIYWTPSTGAFEVHGNIRDKWSSLGWETGFLGYPITDVLTPPDGIGRFTHFQGGSIYFTPSLGAFEIHGPIRDKWAALGWETGFLGYPATDVLTPPDGIGRFVHFQGGSIYWTPSTGAWEIRGSIRDKWAEMGWERSCLGYPISDEEPSTNGWERQSRFQHGIIQWSPQKGALATCSGN